MARILIADDNPNVRRSIRAALEQHEGWIVCGEATNGQEALALAQTSRPDVIVLDVTMPVLDGLRATAAILKVVPDVPIIVYTLHESKQIAAEGKKAGATRVISKMQGITALEPTIEALLAERAQGESAAAAATTSTRSGPSAASDPEPESGSNIAKPPVEAALAAEGEANPEKLRVSEPDSTPEGPAGEDLR